MKTQTATQTTYLKSSVVIALSLCAQLALLLFSATALAQHSHGSKVVPIEAQALLAPTRIEPSQIAELRILLKLKPGFKAYEDQFRVSIIEPEGFIIGDFQVTPVKPFFDRFTKKERMGLSDEGQIIANISAPLNLKKPASNLQIKITYQACTEEYCLFPEDIIVNANFDFVGPIQNLSLKKKSEQSIFDLNFEQVFSQGLVWTFIFVFFFGILTSFTPCVFPMIPITLAILGKDAHARTHTQNFIVSHIYVFGIATTYSILGLLAASTGSLFGSFMAHPLVMGFMCLVFLAMAVSMLGGFDMQAPQVIQDGIIRRMKLTGRSGVFFSGMLAGIVASPCVGPVLVGILTFVAQTQNLWLGFWLLFVYAMGMGQLFLAIGMSSKATKLLPKSGPWMEGVKHFLGILMLGVFYYYLDLLVGVRTWDIAFGLGLVVFGSLMGAFKSLDDKKSWHVLRKGLLHAMVVIGAIYMAVGLLDARSLIVKDISKSHNLAPSQWLPYSEEKLAQAIADGKPVIIDFWADWCAACHQLEAETFPHPRVLLLGPEFVKLKYDATKPSAELDALKKKYEIFGLPTLVFLDSKGQWLKEHTLTAFEDPIKFSQRMEAVLKQTRF